tara:strand:- start:2946 stop:4520 length:1575 start_codon:yes stop_codon:yes gene_type:complete
MNREIAITKIKDTTINWDVVVIGGGASGLGVALDASSRGYKTLLLESYDFAKGTSSKSTKLVHGGVRYLAQGDISLVLEALRERGRLKFNAPHLFENRKFIIPNYRWWGGTFYTVGLKMYDKMSGKLGLGPSQHISKEEVMRYIPNLIEEDLRGGVIYHDGQFDDSRLAINLAQSINDNGGTVANYIEVKSLLKDADELIIGLTAFDKEANETYTIRTKTVVNATGVFVDSILKMDTKTHKEIVMPSQGVHLVLPKAFLPSDYAIMIPKTSDGRVLFAVPWHDKVILGTTDTPREKPEIEPQALAEEIDFILETASGYLVKPPTRKDVLSVFAGLRPLAAVPKEEGKEVASKEVSRSHKIMVSLSGLITIIGGKWTTYRQMGEDVVSKIPMLAGIDERECVTCSTHIHGAARDLDFSKHWHVYGSDLPEIQKMIAENPELGKELHPDLPYTQAEVIWAIRHEMARTIEDVLARRTRALFLDARVSVKMAPKVAVLMANELGYSNDWKTNQINQFKELAKGYILD